MSIDYMTWAYKVKVGDHVAKSVLVKLADNSNDAGVAWPSVKSISEQTEIPERTVKRKLAFLVEAGWISVTKRRAGTGQWGHNVYQLVKQPGATVAHGHRGPPEVTTGGQSLAQEPSLESSFSPPSPPSRAGELTAHYVDTYRAAASQDPPKRTIGQMSRQIKQLLDEGAKAETVVLALELVVEKRLGPSTLPSMMLEAAAGPKRTMRFGRGLTTEQIGRAAISLRQKEMLDEALGSNGRSEHSGRGIPARGA